MQLNRKTFSHIFIKLVGYNFTVRRITLIMNKIGIMKNLHKHAISLKMLPHFQDVNVVLIQKIT